MKVKQCIDLVPREDRKSIFEIVVNSFSFSQELVLSCSARREVRVMHCGHWMRRHLPIFSR